MITIKIKIKDNNHEKIVHVKNNKDCAKWLSLVHGDFQYISIREHKSSKYVLISGKLDLDNWIQTNK
jgi:hypothetical protein